MGINFFFKKLKNKKFIFLILTLLFFVALIIRTYQLSETPSGFHKDELLNTYVSRYIFENGKDITGHPWPILYFDVFGDYSPVIPRYISGLGTYFFGMTVFAARFPIALFGAFLVFPIYFLAKEIFKDKRIAIFSAFLVTILPWHIVMSRATSEGIIALTIIAVGMILLFKACRTGRPLLFVLVGMLFAFTYLVYPSYRILATLIVLPVPFIFTLTKKQRIYAIALVLFLVFLTFWVSSTTWGRGRFEQTSVVGPKSIHDMASGIQTLANEDGSNNVMQVKIYHNKVVIVAKYILNQYLTYFSPQYLFMQGGYPNRYKVADEGLLYYIMLPLLFLSFFYIRKLDKRVGIYLVYIFLISPMPSPLTNDDAPNVHRSLFMIIPLVLFASYGLFFFIDSLKKKQTKIGITVAILAVFVIEFVYFQHMYYHHMDPFKSVDRDDTNKEMVQSVIAQRGNFNKIYMPSVDALPMYYLYFTANFHPSITVKPNMDVLYGLIGQQDNVIFINNKCPSKIIKENSNKKILVVDYTDCELNNRFATIKEFSRHDGTKSFRFLQYISP